MKKFDIGLKRIIENIIVSFVVAYTWHIGSHAVVVGLAFFLIILLVDRQMIIMGLRKGVELKNDYDEA